MHSDRGDRGGRPRSEARPGAKRRPPRAAAAPELTALEPAPAGAEVRAAAARVLATVTYEGRSLKMELGSAQQRIADVRDRALLEAIVMAALRNGARYDAALHAWMPRPLPSREGGLRALLHVGFAQLHALQLPPHAAVAATVEATRLLRREPHAGMVNALLRRATREPLPQATAGANWPQWLRTMLEADWPGDAGAIIEASSQAPPMWLRVNRQRATVAEYAARLADAGIAAESEPSLPDALRLGTPVPVDALPGFSDGVASVQDGSAQRVADALPLRPGLRLLDACAAPGGKSAYMLEREPGVQVIALDSDARRVRRMAETFARLGLELTSLCADATDPADWWKGVPFDAVVVDAPCSATGIVRRQPDILLHRRALDLTVLTGLQSRLLDAAWLVLRPGGTLLYATCSILRVENEAQVRAFLARHADAQLHVFDARFGHDTGAGHQRLPGEEGMDGFFYARIVKGAAANHADPHAPPAR